MTYSISIRHLQQLLFSRATISVPIVDPSLLPVLDFVATVTFLTALWLEWLIRIYHSERTFVTFEPLIANRTVGPYISFIELFLDQNPTTMPSETMDHPAWFSAGSSMQRR